MVHLVSDSTCDLDTLAARRLGIHVVPLTVRFGREEYRDGIDLGPDEFYRRLAASDELPATSQPSPQAFAEVYRRLLGGPGDTIVSVHISRKLSGTLQSAMIAARDVDPQRILAVDSESVTVGLQLLLEAARRDIDAGADAATVVRNLAERRRQLPIYFLLDTISYLHRGGRIGRAQAFIGGVLKVKPVLSLRDGEVHPQSRVRSQQQGIDALVALVRATPSPVALRVVHAAAPDLGARLAARLQEEVPGIVADVVDLGPVVGTYSGPSAVGVACLGTGRAG